MRVSITFIHNESKQLFTNNRILNKYREAAMFAEANFYRANLLRHITLARMSVWYNIPFLFKKYHISNFFS